jgi:hypothetical protein
MAGRFTLNEQELATLVNQFILDGRWDQVGLDKSEASELLLQYFKCLRIGDDIKGFVNGIYITLQNTLMALRKDDFRTIQLEPPFSKFGRQNMREATTPRRTSNGPCGARCETSSAAETWLLCRSTRDKSSQ